MASKFDQDAKTTVYKDDVIRIVMVGKTGAGKSATGNTILGGKKFKSRFSPKSLTKQCAKAYAEVDGQRVAVVDTPGLFDTRILEKENLKDIVQCITYASPGPHIFLIVIKLDRFTEEEKKTVQKIQETFGEEANKYSMVLFTHGDLLKGEPVEEFLKESEDLQEFVAQSNGQYQVFNNELNDRSQVSELIRKIKDITKRNGGSHYTTEMFQQAERAIEEVKEQILKEKEEEMRKEMEEMKKKIEEKYLQQIREIEDDKMKEAGLTEAREREIEEKLREKKIEQDEKARVEAEKSNTILTMLAQILPKVLEQVILRVVDRFLPIE